MAPVSTFYDPRYPPTKFLLTSRHKINIGCIMCGFPRTGTHWIKNVISKSTGLKTGDLYGQKPTYSDKTVLLIKIHARSKRIAYFKAKWLLPPFNFGGKYIYVYRDPRDAIISLYEMYENKIDQQELSIDDFFRLYDPITQYRWEIKSWVFANHQNLLLIKFEELKRCPEKEFGRIFRFIGLNTTSYAKYINEMVATVDNSERPRGTAYGWKTTLKKYEPIIKKVSTELNREIKLLGYDPIR